MEVCIQRAMALAGTEMMQNIVFANKILAKSLQRYEKCVYVGEDKAFFSQKHEFFLIICKKNAKTSQAKVNVSVQMTKPVFFKRSSSVKSVKSVSKNKPHSSNGRFAQN